MTTIDINTAAKRNRSGIVRAATPGEWRVALDAYLSQKDVRGQSRLTYRKALVQFFRWMEETGRTLDMMQKGDVVEYKANLLKTGRSPRTTMLYMVAVKGFYEWAEQEGFYKNITKGVKSSGRTRSSTEFVKMHLTDTEGGEFLEHFRKAPVRKCKNGDALRDAVLEKARNYALASILIRTGIRTVEASRADVGDVCEESGRRLLYVCGKGHDEKDAFVVLSDRAYGPLKAYLDLRPEAKTGDPLFECEGRGSHGRRLSPRSIQSIMKAGLRATGLNDRHYSTHSLRHTAAVQILKRGGSQFDVQDVLRHRSTKTSQIYLESIKRERRIENASELLLDDCFNSPE